MDFRFGSTKIIFKAAVRCLHARQCVCLGRHGMGTVCVRVHTVVSVFLGMSREYTCQANSVEMQER